MRSLFILAWRNVWRNRRRSLITMSAILFSVLIITLTRSLQYGTYDMMEAEAVRLLTGEIQIQRPGYREEETLSYAMPDEDSDLWQEAIADFDWVTASTRRVSGFGLVSTDHGSAGAFILGVDPESERRVSAFSDRVSLGLQLEEDSDHETLIGETLARNLRVEVGDTIVVLTQGYRNEMGAELYRVRGLLKTGSIEMDRVLMVLRLPDAQQLFSMDGRITQVVLRTVDFREAPVYAEQVKEVLPEDRFAVYDWDTLMPELRQMIILDNASGMIFLLFMLVLVGFEIFNTTTMSVVERSREFGVLQAVGMQPRYIASIVLVELLIKITLALAFSIGASALLLWYLEGHPIPLTEEMTEMYKEFGFSIDALLFSTRSTVFLEPLISIAVISLLATVYPVLRVLRIEPVEALRYAT